MSEHAYAMIGKYFCLIIAAVSGLVFFSILYIAVMYFLLRKFRLLRFLFRIVMRILNQPPKSSDYSYAFTTMIERDGSTWGAMD